MIRRRVAAAMAAVRLDAMLQAQSSSRDGRLSAAETLTAAR